MTNLLRATSPDMLRASDCFARETQKRSLPYMPGLDGIRGISVSLVIGVHTSVWFMLGGGIGVDIFFVLSGFLISGVLITEFQSTGRIDFVAFYWRRFLRIMPPLIAVCVGLICVAPFVGIMFSTLARDFSATLTFVANYTRARGGYPLYLAPTWSLSIEEQFYLAWPALALGLLMFVREQHRIAAIMLGCAVGVAFWRGYRFLSETNLMAIYDSFDSRCDALCFGCALAFLDERRLRFVAGLWPLAIVSLAALVYASSWEQPWMYFGGFSLIGVSAAILIAAAVCRNSPILSSILEASPLRALGRISYSLYLWHWIPVILLWSAGVRGAMLLTSIPIAIVPAVLSTKFIERPASRRKGLQTRSLRICSSLVVPILFVLGILFILPRAHQ